MTIEQRLAITRGFTDNPYLADWLLPDGHMTNGSYEGRQRDIDHAEISGFFKHSKNQEPGNVKIYIRKFMRRGNIRMGASTWGFCFEFDRTPNEAQLKTLIPNILDAIENHVEVCAGKHRPPITQMHLIKRMTGYEFLEYLNRYIFQDNFETLYQIDHRIMNII